ncbi:MAG: SGNH-hydro domain-containing protein [Sporanaerobacter sp.]|mgnify:CR=1 FL=1|jgi:lysophospholipase L1-like esterase|uniref:GDSL-type esterase/lipase family protein n=1 Tax=Sporanaerobacter sp. TaxID=2010183 RepID=UPI003A0FD15E
MAKRRRKKRKIIIANKKRFTLSMIVIVGIVFVLSKSIKAIQHKDKKETIIIEKNNIACSAPKSIEDIPELSEKDTVEEQKLSGKEEKVQAEENSDVELNNDEKVDPTEIDDKNKNYSEIFKDDLFVGDSITDSLSFYEILEEKNVIAKLGLTVVQGEKEINNIKKANPSNIYLLFGMNDVLMGIDGQKFAKNYAEFVHKIQDELPDANIYVQSVIPVSPNVKQKKPLLNNVNIDKFNEALMQMCKDENINYIDLRPILENESELYEPDGIHLKYKFYKLWLNYLIDNTKK